MRIKKKSGAYEAFSAEKLANSIASAADEAYEPMNESDLKLILSEFLRIVEGKDCLTSQQISTIIIGILHTKGYIGVLKSYATFSKGA